MRLSDSSKYALAFLVTSLAACSADATTATPTDTTDAGTLAEELTGSITADKTLSKSGNYLLKGLVTVKAPAKLTIEPGTVIKGDNASKGILLIEPGAQILAEGTATAPIVFTSQAPEGQRRPGDWGGIIILGNAPVNMPGGKGNVEGILKTTQGSDFGGASADDSSGKLRYVRVEYAGVELSKDNEVNGITFGGVGRGTVIDHVQVRFALDDCFEWFGGTVDAKYLACQYNQDDGFDFDNGYSGRLQFLVLQQDPSHAGEDNGFESDNDATGTSNAPFTSPQVFNATLCGKNRSVDGMQFGMLLRKNTRGTYRNVLVDGFQSGIDLRDAPTVGGMTGAGSLSISHSLFFGSTGTGVVGGIAFLETGTTAPDKDNDGAFDEVAYIKDPTRANMMVDPGVTGCFSATSPSFGPAAPQTGTAPPADGFFDTSATYVGAFKDAADTWATSGTWAVWSDK